MNFGEYAGVLYQATPGAHIASFKIFLIRMANERCENVYGLHNGELIRTEETNSYKIKED